MGRDLTKKEKLKHRTSGGKDMSIYVAANLDIMNDWEGSDGAKK